jgi:hypothetical protein
MKKYNIIKISTMWSTSTLISDIEKILNKKTKEGFEIVRVSFGINLWYMPTAYITLSQTTE